MDEDNDRDVELEEAMRVTEIANRHAGEFYNTLIDISAQNRDGPRQFLSIDYVEEMFRCAIEEVIGEPRQKPKGFDPLTDRFPHV